MYRVTTEINFAYGHRLLDYNGKCAHPHGHNGRVEIELRGHHVESLAGEVAGFGAALEVLDPPELRERLARVGAELTATYRRRR